MTTKAHTIFVPIFALSRNARNPKLAPSTPSSAGVVKTC
jgi:hypothetical protein